MSPSSSKPPLRIIVLHVEDSDDDAMQIELALDMAKPDWKNTAELHRARSVGEARKMVVTLRPQLLLLDLNLPGLSGHDYLVEIKKDPSTASIPVLVLSTSDADGDVLKAYHNYASCYLVKPASFAQLVSIMSTMQQFWFEHARLPL